MATRTGMRRSIIPGDGGRGISRPASGAPDALTATIFNSVELTI